MKRSDLKELGLTDDAVIDAIMEAHGKDVEKFKTSVETSKTEAETLKAQLTEANTQIEKFKGMDVDGIKAAADEWKSKAETAEREAAEKLYNFKFDNRLEKKLKDDFKVKNPKRVIQDLDKSMLKYDEAKDDIIGNLEEQIKPIREKEDYLFADVTEPPKIVTGGNNQPVQKSALEAAFDRGAGIKEK